MPKFHKFLYIYLKNKLVENFITLFYVDDDDDDLGFFEEAVQTLGHEVHLFNLADKMIEALNNPPPSPSMVFLDLNMPGKSGFEIINEIRQSEMCKDLPIVVYSTAADFGTIKKCREHGANLYITKPTSMSALQRALKHVLAIDLTQVQDKNFLYLP